ncbi:hypothetical protein Acsp01_90950 [Actinoplanes sp. NBRC 101535]|nr:hypothetical protein Acsp01_90950 [Actinoplanes sp. NBRC 101535]
MRTRSFHGTSQWRYPRGIRNGQYVVSDVSGVIRRPEQGTTPSGPASGHAPAASGPWQTVIRSPVAGSRIRMTRFAVMTVSSRSVPFR